MKFSSQVLYNLPLDVLANVPFVDVPEGESLGFSDEIDLYRQYSTPSSLAGKAVISNELGATQSKAYSQTMPDLLWSMKRSIAGSVNNFILHIYPFSGQYYNTTWPGYTTFTYLFSGMNGPRQPSWAFFSDISGWMARSHYVSQQGTAKLDIVFWLNQQAGLSLDDGYSDGDLEDAGKSKEVYSDKPESPVDTFTGFTYGYFSPANLDLPTSYVEDKIFAPSTISSKALVLRSDSILTPEGVSKLVQYAQAGLCVVFDGDIPRGFAGAVSSQTQKSALRSLSNTLKLPNVHQFTTGSLADNLQKVGIEPRTRVRMTRTIHTHWREDDDRCFTFVSVFNDGFADVLGEGLAEGEIEFETLGSPYVYDAWTGEVSPVREFTQTGLRTVVPMRLRGNESSVIVFHRGPKAQGNETGYHDFDRPSECSWTEAQRALFRQLPSSAPRITALPPAENIQLNKWTLNVEAWLAPSNLTSLEPLITTTTYNLTDLLPWHKISESLRNVSGRGTYSTTFEWQRGDRYGAKLDLGALLDVSRAWINGHQLAPLDPAKPVADLTKHLVYGQNVITIVVTTSLANSMRPVWSQLMSGGVGNMGPLPTLQDYGLVLPVIVEPYEVICC
jgi:hypothetical protein